MSDDAAKRASERNETEDERLDRNLSELLEELRVALPGVQVLFAFLLVVPFQQTFVDVTEFQKHVYYVTLCSTAVASTFLIAPTARHRLRFREGDKEYIVASSNRLAITGLAFLALSITGVILLISDFIFAAATAAVATAVIASLLAWVWFGAPLVRGLRERREGAPAARR